MVHLRTAPSEDVRENCDFREGLAPIPGEGYIDRTGWFVIRNELTRMAPFANGLAAFHGREPQTFGYLNRSGRMVIGPHRWTSLGWAFDCGHAFVRPALDVSALIDQSGRRVIEPRSAYQFLRYDAGWISMNESGQWSVRNLLTGITINLKPDEEAGRFYGGQWVTVLPFDPKSFGPDLCTIYDESGETVGRFRFEGAYIVEGRYADRLMLVADDCSRCCGYLNLHGQQQIETKYRRAYTFREGLAAASESGYENWGYLDPQGNWAIEPRAGWLNADSFHNGVAAVQIGTDVGLHLDPWARTDRWGYIDRRGEWVLPPVFLKARPFCEGLAHVEFLFSRRPLTAANRQYCLTSDQAYIDQDGTIVYPPHLAGVNLNDCITPVPNDPVATWQTQVIIPESR